MRIGSLAVYALGGVALVAASGRAEESSSYLGRKLEFVLRNLDNGYVERNRKDFSTRYRKAFEDLGDHLAKRYPTLERDLIQWLEQHYASEMRRADSTADGKHLPFDVILAIDRGNEDFRGELLAHIRADFPALLGEIACFLRDHYPNLLSEVLRMTLRMTSTVRSAAQAAAWSPTEFPAPAETTILAVPAGVE